MLENESFLAGILGGKNVGTPITLNSLAKLYREQGKYAEAEALYQRSLAIREQTLETSSQHTLRRWAVARG